MPNRLVRLRPGQSGREVPASPAERRDRSAPASGAFLSAASTADASPFRQAASRTSHVSRRRYPPSHQQKKENTLPALQSLPGTTAGHSWPLSLLHDVLVWSHENRHLDVQHLAVWNRRGKESTWKRMQKSLEAIFQCQDPQARAGGLLRQKRHEIL